jgi:hypothetical protein
MLSSADEAIGLNGQHFSSRVLAASPACMGKLKPEPCRAKQKRPFPKGEPRLFNFHGTGPTGFGRVSIRQQ